MTRDELDARLRQVLEPAPVIVVGPGHPIRTYPGWGDPYENYYRGARVVLHPGMGEDCGVEESGSLMEPDIHPVSKPGPAHDRKLRHFSETDLANLEAADPMNRPLMDMVHTYRAARAHFLEVTAMITAEMDYYQLA